MDYAAAVYALRIVQLRGWQVQFLQNDSKTDAREVQKPMSKLLTASR